MKRKMNIKGIAIIVAVGIISFFCINLSLAANTGKISVETANLRETADENAKILEQLSKDKEVEIIEKDGDWYKVKAQGMTGYLRQDLVTVQEENTTTSNEVSTEEEVKETENTTESNQTEENKQESETDKRRVVEDTKLKIVPVINATDIIEVKKDEEVTIVEVLNGWVCIETKTTKGWIREEKLKKEEAAEVVEQPAEQPEQTVKKTLYVNAESVNVRKAASKSAEVVTTLPANTAVEVIKEENNWTQIKANGKEGYISSSLLSETRRQTSRSSTARRETTTETNSTQEQQTTTSASTSGKGSTVVATAQNYIGSKYVYGGSSPSGFDCSGFTSYVYKLHGVTLSRTAAGQYSNGVAVSRSELQPGDLVMFGKSGINHVGIYIGGGKMVHAANASTGVTTSSITSGYYNNNYVGARRVI